MNPERSFEGLSAGPEAMPFQAYFAAIADRTGTGHYGRDAYASLVLWNGGASWPVSVYMIVTALAALLCAYLAGEIAVTDQRRTKTVTKRDALAAAGRSYK